MKFVGTILLILFATTLQSQHSDSKSNIRIIEEYPLCCNCSVNIKNFIDQQFTNSTIDVRDTIICCFKIDSLTNISNVEIKNTNNAELMDIVSRAIYSPTTWMPAFNRGIPTTCTTCFKINFKKNGGRIETQNFGLPSEDFDGFMKAKMEKYYLRYFKESSAEKISHLNINKVNFYAISNFHRYREQRLTESIHLKTSNITIKNSGTEMTWTIFIPKFKIFSTSALSNNENFRIENVPVEHEIILLILKKEGNQVLISIEKIEYNGQKTYAPVFNEYTFDELQQKIMTYSGK